MEPVATERMFVAFGYAGPSIVAVAGPWLEQGMEWGRDFEGIEVAEPGIKIGLRVWEGTACHHCDAVDEDCDCEVEFSGTWRLPTADELHELAHGRNPWAAKKDGL